MSKDLLARIEQWKSRFGGPETGQLERLLADIERRKFRTAEDLARLHETLLFLRAYPRNTHVAHLADELLFSFGERMKVPGADLEYFEQAEISGVAGTSLCAVFSYEVARQLVERHPFCAEIGWDRYDEVERLGPVLQRFLPLFNEDWPVEAHVPYQEWLEGAHGRGSDLKCLMDMIATLPEAMRADVFDSAQIPITWRIAGSHASRSHLRLPVRNLYIHSAPLLRRSDISLEQETNGPALKVRRLKPGESRRLLETIVDTSAMRYRELYGFSHPDTENVYHADFGRGVDLFYFGVPAAWRLPLRAYHGGMFFKNGVPAGYVEVLSLFERAEVGFNLYYTFREGESAWLYARLLHLFRQELGVTCFSVDPYQIGQENPEAIESGAFWFYRKLGFRAAHPDIAKLVAREEARMRSKPGYRTSPRILRQLAEGYILYEMPGTGSGDWDGFRVRKLAQALQSGKGMRASEAIQDAKQRGEETQYLRLMQKDVDLRAEWIRLGS